MSLPTPEEARREIAEDRGTDRRRIKINPDYPPEFARQDEEDEMRCDYCDELPDDCQCQK